MNQTYKVEFYFMKHTPFNCLPSFGRIYSFAFKLSDFLTEVCRIGRGGTLWVDRIFYPFN